MRTVVCGLLLAASAGALAQSNEVPFETHPAVQLTWPGTEGKQYQVFTSPDLHTWTRAGPPVPGLGGAATYNFDTDGQPRNYFWLAQLAAPLSNRFVGLQQIWWKPADIAKDTNGLSFFNLRLRSANLSPADLLQATFSFDFASQAFRVASYTVFTNIGVFNSPYFVADNTNTMYLCHTNQTPMPEAQFYTIAADGSEYYLDLTAGQVLSFQLHPFSGDLWFRVADPDGQLLNNSILIDGVPIIERPYPVVKSGRYTVRFIPRENSQPSVYFAFLNANRRLLRPISDGSTISCNLAPNFWDYAKYQIDLQPNEVLSFSSTWYYGTGTIRITILNAYSEIQLSVLSQFKFQPTVAGRYYVIVDNSRGGGGSFNATMSVSQVSPPPHTAAPISSVPQQVKPLTAR